MKFLNLILFILLLSISACDILESVNTSDAALELYGENPYDFYDGTANSCDGNDDGLVSQGESVRIKLRAVNNGDEDADNVILTVETNDPFVSILRGREQTLGDMVMGEIIHTAEANTAGSILLAVQEGTPNGHIAEFDVDFEDNISNHWDDQFSIVVNPINAAVVLYGNNPWKIYDGSANGANGNGDSELNPGEIANIKLRARNEGDSEAMMVQMVASTSDSYVSIVDDSTYTFGDMPSYRIQSTADANTTSALTLQIDDSTPSGHTAEIAVEFTDKFSNRWNDVFNVIIY